MTTFKALQRLAPVLLATFAAIGVTAAPAFAESHPEIGKFGSFSNPNGIAVEESTGGVYVANIGVGEQQTVRIEGGPTGGSFTLEFEGQKTSPLSISETTGPTEGEVESALQALTSIGSGNVSVSEVGAFPGTVTYTITFQGALAARKVSPLLCDGAALTGGSGPKCAVATATQGAESTISKFTGSGGLIESWGTKGQLSGSGTPAKSFSFPNVYGTPAAIAVDNACVQHTPALTGKACEEFDPSAGDLYVMDAGHGVIDKFNSEGRYLSQIGGFQPSTGGAKGDELLGLGVDGSGTVHVDLSTNGEPLLMDEFDGAAVNHLIARQELEAENEPEDNSGIPESRDSKAHGFAVSATGDDYPLYEPSCSCTLKFGQKLSPLGRVDNGEAGDVAVAVDPATGHLYADDQSSVAEWDTGAMNRNSVAGAVSSGRGVGTLVARFGSLQLSSSSGEGGIAVSGASGQIYVSNPASGKVYIFGSDAPAVTVSQPTNVTREAASLSGTVDPRGVAVSSCEFEYGLTNEYGNGPYDRAVPCKQTPEEIGAGSSPVTVSAQLEDLTAGELYHFRLDVSSANGSSESSGMLATQGVGFGIKNFEVNFLNENGTPDTQAGSHPYRFVNSFTLNSHFKRSEADADSPYIRLPNGILRDLTLDLPPGFVGDPSAPSQKCTGEELRRAFAEHSCPPESGVGELYLSWSEAQVRLPELYDTLYATVPPRGVALQLGTNFFLPLLYINNGVLAGGDYPAQATVTDAPTTAPVFRSRVVISGIVGEGVNRKPFLTLPTGCHGPLRSTMAVDSWEEPGQWAKATSITRNSAGTPVSLTGCSKLKFPPTIEVKPDVSDASTSTGLTVGVRVPQTAAANPDGLAESALRDTTVTLPAGVALNPAGANGLEACSEGLAGFTGFNEFNSEYEPGVKTATFTPTLPGSIAAAEAGETAPLQPGVNFCPNGSKIGTVKIKTPLLESPLEGAVYLAAQNSNPFGSLVAMYIIAEDPVSGTLIKLAGELHLSETGQIVTTFENTPDLPFEELELHFFGGERAALTTPSRCGTYTTTASFVPWDGNGPVNTSSSFQITSGPNGSPCPGASLPFSPSLTGGATNVNAGAFSPFTLTMTRKDGEQNLQSVEAKLPPGLSGILSNIELCPEPQANLGECPPNSLIGETTLSVGVGGDPFSVTGGKFYLTGPYNGSGGCTVGAAGCAPFGITFEVPAKAGPFDLKRNTANPAGEDPCDCVIVRGKIEINPITAAITIVSDPPGSPDAIPASIEGIPLEIQHINATTTRGDFQFNPTNCDKMEVTGTIHSSENSTATIGVPFQVTNCATLAFKPGFEVSTSAKTSRANGASLNVKLTYPNAPFGSQANLRTVKVDLPKRMPSRLTTLQKACTAAQFEANPAGCPAASIVGHGKAITPLIPVPLEGPAYFVSYGGAQFPELVIVLQGYGVTLDLHGETFINKAGITSSTFHAVPDAPVGSFELTLPEGQYSALTANADLCTSKLAMPTEFVAQNGAEIHQSTPIEVEGCPGDLAITSHSIKKTTATLAIYVPAAGTVKVSGKGLSTKSTKVNGRGTITVKLNQKKVGRLRTKVAVLFTPNTGRDRKKQSKAVSLKFAR